MCHQNVGDCLVRHGANAATNAGSRAATRHATPARPYRPRDPRAASTRSPYHGRHASICWAAHAFSAGARLPPWSIAARESCPLSRRACARDGGGGGGRAGRCERRARSSKPRCAARPRRVSLGKLAAARTWRKRGQSFHAARRAGASRKRTGRSRRGPRASARARRRERNKKKRPALRGRRSHPNKQSGMPRGVNSEWRARRSGRAGRIPIAATPCFQTRPAACRVPAFHTRRLRGPGRGNLPGRRRRPPIVRARACARDGRDAGRTLPRLDD